MSRIFGSLAIAACAATILYVLYASFWTYALEVALPSDTGWYWDVWSDCGKLLLGVCAPLVAFIFWIFRVPRAMYAKWIFRIFGATLVALSLFGLFYEGLNVVFAGLSETWRWTQGVLGPTIALLTLGIWTLILNRPERRHLTADVVDGESGK